MTLSPPSQAKTSSSLFQRSAEHCTTPRAPRRCSRSRHLSTRRSRSMPASARPPLHAPRSRPCPRRSSCAQCESAPKTILPAKLAAAERSSARPPTPHPQDEHDALCWPERQCDRDGREANRLRARDALGQRELHWPRPISDDRIHPRLALGTVLQLLHDNHVPVAQGQ
jgi:hypothetical protein